ncbi:hypothetical protein BVRB_3g070120 [Beta vulgaris subsp. vulgaris]|nr:hypothetical protein BVRB_3g070120 [Beta vulgaris subsp. vulgaris]
MCFSLLLHAITTGVAPCCSPVTDHLFSLSIARCCCGDAACCRVAFFLLFLLVDVAVVAVVDVMLPPLREQVLRELGFKDIFKKVKDDENAKAIYLFSNVVNLNDAIEDPVKRSEHLVRGIFAGNIFDLGSAQAVIFVNNSGANIIVGILPFARELLRRGTQVCFCRTCM